MIYVAGIGLSDFSIQLKLFITTTQLLYTIDVAATNFGAADARIV
jgi:hypothetical protein